MSSVVRVHSRLRRGRTPAAANHDDLYVTQLLADHILATRAGLEALTVERERIARWARGLHRVLHGGGRVLVAGNGGSAALGQHLTAELVGRYQSERPPFSAISLTADTATLTALGNDYGFEQTFARQVRAHGRKGDILVLLTTSGRSANLLEAAKVARPLGVATWALTGPVPNPLAEQVDDTLALPGGGAIVQEVQQVVVHLLCDAFDAFERTRREDER